MYKDVIYMTVIAQRRMKDSYIGAKFLYSIEIKLVYFWTKWF